MPRLVKLADPALQAKFLCALDAVRVIAAAAASLGLNVNAVSYARIRIPAFDAEVRAVLSRPVYEKRGHRKFLPFQRLAFIEALAESGCAARAGRASGVSDNMAYGLKRRDARFAAAWADARDEARDRAYGRILDAAINGFVRTETIGGVEKRTVTHEARAVLTLLASHRARAGTGRDKTVVLTPELRVRARDTLLRRLTDGGGLTTMAEAIEYAAMQTATLSIPALTA